MKGSKMLNNRKTFLASTALLASVVAATALYAHESNDSQGRSMMNGGMMGGMHAMMANCRQMMASMNGDADGRGRPNAQWRSTQPRSE